MSRLTLFLPLLSLSLVAQDATEKELLDILNTPVTVASAKATTLRESPGVITVLTHEEIQATGGRDLIDVLRMVPGFDFGFDSEGATGLFARGLWAYEGKALVLLDGIEMPELLYGNMLLGHRFPIDQIKRIEIIRGPGSAIYGGLAELAVIKIVTLQGEDLNGGGGAVKVGVGGVVGSASGRARSALNALIAPSWGDAKLTVGLFTDNGHRSSATYTEADGTTHDAGDASEMKTRMANVGFSNGGFSFRGLLEDYKIQDPTLAGYRSFISQNGDLRYAWKANEALTLTPYYDYRRVLSWSKPGRERTVQRDKVGLTLGWDISSRFGFNSGVERYTDTGSVAASSAGLTSVTFDGAQRVTYGVNAAYAELSYHGPVNVTVGGRYEDHSEAGSAFVPRFAITWVGGAFHAKLLVAGAFRTPNVQVFANRAAADTKIESEKTKDVELEAGWQAGGSLLTLTLFQTKLEKPLVYGAAGYTNGAEVTSKGGELEWKWRQSWGFVNASYSLNSLDNQVPDWSVPGHDDRTLGASANKLAVYSGIKLGGGFSLDPSLALMGDRWGYDYDAGAGNVVLKKFDAALLVNLQLVWSQGPWTASLGGFDLGDKRPGFIQAFHDPTTPTVPLPDSGREIVAKVRYGF
ncbi:MAG TPA: TonB-dependent receptor plug domain-containing protein [Holophagaceae bacterium]|nr:TonB-dependent receptor plug domain-containing protein [Holophagaceae bacterium]